MKPCASYELLISRYIDNDLDNEESGALQRHIAACGACRTTLDDYVKIKKLVCTSFVPAEDHAAGVRSVKPADKPIWRMRWDLKLAALLAFAVALIAGFSVRIMQSPEIQAHAEINAASPLVMNAPMGSLVYYQEFSGDQVHSQFVNVTTSPVTDIGQETEAWARDMSYDSPLFGDAITTDAYTSE